MVAQLADGKPHRILLIEDDDADAGLVTWALRRQGDFPYQLEHLPSLESYLGVSPHPDADVILLDLNLPGYAGLEAFRVVADTAPDAAVVVLTGLDDNEVAMAAVHSGAQDYLVKQNVNPHEICRAIRYAAERRASRELLLRVCDDFLAHVSHELRTPLAAAAAALEMLEEGDGGELRPGQARLAGMAATNVRLLRAMVADLIDSAMVRSGTLRVHAQPVRLLEVVAPALEALSPLIAQARLSSAMRVDGDLIVFADPDRLTQVVTNLIANSIKYTPAGGSVEIGAGPSLADDGSSVVLTVDDSGAGIPGDALPRLFDRLYQVPNEPDRASRGGLGLGLFLCRELVRAQHGDIQVASTPGRGTRVTVTLPSARTGAPDSPAGSHGMSGGHGAGLGL